MKKIILVFIFILCVAESNSQNISVRFAPNGKRDKFCSQMSLKEGFEPFELQDPGMVSVWFEYKDSSIVFMTRRGWTPNMRLWFKGEKCENNMKSVPYLNQVNIGQDTILIYAFEGVDSVGQYWKEMMYIDKRYLMDSTINTSWYKAVVGYYNVRSEQKEKYDMMLDSYIILQSDKYDFSQREKHRFFMFIDN